MKFGLFYQIQVPKPWSADSEAKRIWEALDQIAYAEEMDYGVRLYTVHRGGEVLLHAVLDRYWFTNNGPLVQELEERLAHFLGVEHCVATCNGTIALALLVRALALQGEVIIPSFSFISTAHVLLWQGLDPVFCDIDPATWNIAPGHCETLITWLRKTSRSPKDLERSPLPRRE